MPSHFLDQFGAKILDKFFGAMNIISSIMHRYGLR